MSLDKATVTRIARLARIKVPEAELDPLAAELDKIIGWVSELDAVDTRKIPPMSQAANLKLRWREDRVTDGGIRDQVLANAPDSREGYFAVPKVVE